MSLGLRSRTSSRVSRDGNTGFAVLPFLIIHNTQLTLTRRAAWQRVNRSAHGPLHTRPECWKLKSSVDERSLMTQRATLYLNVNERHFWKIVKKSGTDVRSWDFFTSKIQPSSKRKKNFSFVRPFLIFLQFFKNRSWNFFTFRRGLYLDVKKFQLRTSIHSWFFLQFFKNRVQFPFKYTVECHVVSLRSSTEDFYIPALCEVGRGFCRPSHTW